VSWQPPERPEWVRAINAGAIVPIAQEARLPLERDALMAEARGRLGLADRGIADFTGDGFGPDELLEPLDRLLPALEQEAELTLIGRWMTRRFLLRLLEVRLQLMAYLRADPAVRDEPLERPLFVAGAPRTGTTALHDLLARDPGLRAPLGWELLRPVPPPAPDAERDGRVELADRELVLPQTVVSGLLAIHVYGGRQPKECLSAMSFAFRSEEFTARYHVPSYEAWLERCDMEPAYRMHRLVLQVLQRRTGAAAWVLKSPVHLHSLPTLFSVHPEACVAVTHRDPLAVLGSLTSLIATLRYAHSDRVDFAGIAAAHARRYRRSFDALVDACVAQQLPETKLHHIRHAELLADPIGVVRALYERFGRPLPAAFLARPSDASSRPGRGDHGPHEYAFEDLELDATEERAAFRRYQQHFDVPSEPEPRSRGRS
jgi:hypothetical protein